MFDKEEKITYIFILISKKGQNFPKGVYHGSK